MPRKQTPPDVVAKIKSLRAQGWKVTRIARVVGVSYATVGRYLGLITDQKPAPIPRKYRPEPGEPSAIDKSHAKRCPGCGGLVVMPCVLCQARRGTRDEGSTYREPSINSSRRYAERSHG